MIEIALGIAAIGAITEVVSLIAAISRDEHALFGVPFLTCAIVSFLAVSWGVGWVVLKLVSLL